MQTLPAINSTVTIKRQPYVVVETEDATEITKRQSNGAVIGSVILRKPRGSKHFFSWVRSNGTLTDPA